MTVEGPENLLWWDGHKHFVCRQPFLCEFFAYETIGATIPHVVPFHELPLGDGRVLRLSQTCYDELVAIKDDDLRLCRLLEMLGDGGTDHPLPGLQG